MPDYPPEAAEAAAEAIMIAQNANDDEPERWEARHLARAALDAAAPILAEAVAQKITEHKYAHEPKGPLIGGKTAAEQRRRTWRRHFSIAAQVASLAFTTREELLRQAAEAIERGDAVWCDIPETPDERTRR